MSDVARLTARCAELEQKLHFLYYWMIRADESLRDLTTGGDPLTARRARNDAAFAYKWASLGLGYASLENPDHRATIEDIVLSCTGLPRRWFAGRRVLDAGCGDGRLSFGLCRLGAHVTSIDKIPRAIARTREHCRAFDHHRALVWDLLEPWPRLCRRGPRVLRALSRALLGRARRRFDLVLAFGVAHHTGDTRGALENLARLVRPGGYLSIMVYGYPRLDQPGDFAHLVRKEKLRQSIRHLSFEEAREVIRREIGDDMAIRGWFDATTPRIEDHYTFEQVAAMLRECGFGEIEHLNPDARNVCVRGRRMTRSGGDTLTR